jgi:alcohol dehydrogenase (NADP+)
VYALSHTPGKKDDALKLGAKEFINTTEKDWSEPWKFTFDFIVNCADATSKFNLSEYFGTLKVNGVFHNVGLPDEPLSAMSVGTFVPNGCYMGASHIGNRPEMLAMLELASKQNIKSWVQTIDISEEGCKEAVEKVYKNDVRYRYTLVNFDKQFGKRA